MNLSNTYQKTNKPEFRSIAMAIVAALVFFFLLLAYRFWISPTAEYYGGQVSLRDLQNNGDEIHCVQRRLDLGEIPSVAMGTATFICFDTVNEADLWILSQPPK